MSLVDAVVAAGPLPPDDAAQAKKKRYSEMLSSKLAVEVAKGLRGVGFQNVKPLPGGPGEKAFQGGLGPKKVDVAYSDERHGLLLAVSIKTINAAPYGKNLKNRFADLCTECITLHMRFPYVVLSAIFAFPAAADEDVTDRRTVSTFARATKLLATVSGRSAHSNAAEKFENAVVMLFQPPRRGGPKPRITLTDVQTGRRISEKKYYLTLREIYNARNPHASIGE